MADSKHKTLSFLSGLLCLLVCLGSSKGLFTPDFYNLETLNWRAQSVGQDIVNLFLICPLLLVFSVLIYLKNEYAFSMWAGTLLYLIYTYVIYCFNVHFNSYFLIYCLSLGLSFYLFIYFIYTQFKEETSILNIKNQKIIAVYFISIAILFYFLWLADILPAIYSNTIPESLLKAGLITNPVHVLDLSIVLPGFLITGILLLKRRFTAIILAPILLSFIILMDITICVLTVFMSVQQIESGYLVAIVMVALAIFSMILLIQYLKAQRHFYEKDQD